MEIKYINDKKTYIDIYYFPPTNSNFYKKCNIDKKNCPYNGLEHDISSQIKEGNMFLMVDFNAQILNNQSSLLSNYSNPNPLCL